MAHNPVNHPARPVYRAIGGLTGLYMVIFGGLGLAEAGGAELLAQDDTLVLGQGANKASALVFLVLGLVILLAVGIGRNIDAFVTTWLAYLLMALGLACLAVLRTDANYLNFSVSTCVVAMLLGVVLLLVGLYGKVGSDEEARVARETALLP